MTPEKEWDKQEEGVEEMKGGFPGLGAGRSLKLAKVESLSIKA